MSRKGVTTICKSKQIPRIFQRRSHAVSGSVSAGGVRTTWESSSVALVDEHIDKAHRYGSPNLLLDSCENYRAHGEDCEKVRKQRENGGACESLESYASRVCSYENVNNPTIPAPTIESESNDAAETVADIEKWLKTRTESVSSMDLDAIKCAVEEEDEGDGVERYLGDDLPHTFLGKGPDGLSIDIDLSDKKLNLDYDPILQELQSDKLLEACEKNDDFALPEFRLDHLDPLALSPDDMMVAGEILPSTSGQLNLVPVIHGDEEDATASKEINGEIEDSVDSEAAQVCVEPEEKNVYETKKKKMENEAEEIDKEIEFKEEEEGGREESFVGEIAGFVHLAEAVCKPRVEGASLAKQRKVRSKLEPRIMKRGRKLCGKFEKNGGKIVNSDCRVEAKDGIMAVVAISTDKVSNMTQIVINNGREEQIYQGKTSELIEATGNFPKLAKIDAAGNWSSSVPEFSADVALGSQNETVISNALEELGITDECLQPSAANENGRTWLCPRDDCSREFTKLHALKGHLLAHYGVRPFKCDFEGCAWAFHSEFKLKRHKETHLKRKDFVCEVAGCNRRFTTVYNLWSHEKLHTRPNRIVCQVPDCQEKFQTKRALELHMKSHDQSHAPYVCSHEGCGKRYYSSNALTSHQRCHSYKEIDVKCSWAGCGKVFDKPCRLKAHIRSHTGCKPYTCTYQDCQWAFSSSSKLKRHEKKHTNERKFVCDVEGCGKAFMRSEHLKEHALTHREGRYFQCYMCDARFSAKSSLYVHIKKHQVKEAVQTITQRTTSCKVSKFRRTTTTTNEPQGTSEIKFAADNKVASGDENVVGIEEFYEDPSISGNFIQVSGNGEDSLVSTRCFIQSPNDILSRIDTQPDFYICGVEDCAKSCKTPSTLRNHVIAMHGNTIEDCDKSSIGAVGSGASVSSLDFILCAAPRENVATSAASSAASATPENVELPPEPEPPPIGHSQSSYCAAADDPPFDQRSKRSNQGSARTGLTRADVWKLKADGSAAPDTVAAVGASDVVLSSADLAEGLLLTEELPSMYYQDDMVGTECQILLLDAGASESAIHLRGLD